MLIKEIFNYKKSKNYIRPYIIAEVGVNHECDMKLAKRLIREDAESGADAVKFQSYKADTLASKNSPAYWDTSKEKILSQHQLFKKYDKFWKTEFVLLKEYCDEYQIEFMSTPFDLESANFLNDLMDVFKISSSDITNKPFIEYLCNFNKPIILSTGASSLEEIGDAINWIKPFDNQLALLHCILNYPTDEINANLGMILDLKEKFPNNIIGYSDHTMPEDMKVMEIASLIGCSIIEKHFTHDKQLPGNDHYHAMDKDDLKKYFNLISRISNLFGRKDKNFIETENISRLNARRSLVFNQDLKKDSIIANKHLTWKRPADGISPKYIENVVGQRLIKDIVEDDILQWEMFDANKKK